MIKTNEKAIFLSLDNSIFQFNNICQIPYIINQEINDIKILNNIKNIKIDDNNNWMENNIFGTEFLKIRNNESFKFIFEINPKNKSKIYTKIE